MRQINASRISFARTRRRMTKAQLAKTLGLTSRSIQIILEIINTARAVLNALDVFNGHQLLNNLFRNIFTGSLGNVI